MAKLSLTTIASGYGSVDALNANFDAIEAAIENTVSRDGTAPNYMSGGNFDMNGERIVNLPAPGSSTEPVRLVDLSDSDATGAATAQLRLDLADDEGTELIGFIQSGTGAVAEVLQSVLRYSVFSARSFNVLPTNTAAANTTNMVVAIAASVAAGRVLFIPDGDYPLNQLVSQAGMMVVASPGARMVKSDTTTPFVTQPDFGTKCNGVYVEGGSWGADDAANTGRIFQLYGDDITIKDTTVDGFYIGASTGGAYLIGGDRIRMIAPKSKNAQAAAGVLGIRYFGGDDFICSDACIESGDDSLQLVPINPANTNGNQSISNAGYINCRATSAVSRPIAVCLDDSGADTFTSSITNFFYDGINCSADGPSGAAMGLVVMNFGSTGNIERGEFTNINIDASGLDTSNTRVVDVRNDHTGQVRDIFFNGLTIKDPFAIGVVIRAAGSNYPENIRFSDVFVDAPRTSSIAFQIREGNNITLERGRIVGCATLDENVISVGIATSTACRGITIRDLVIQGIGSTGTSKYGVSLVKCTQGSLENIVVQEASGAVNARAFNIAADSSDIRIIGGDVSLLTEGATTRIVNAGTNVYVRHVKGFVTKNAGTGTVANGATNSGNIAHGLAVTPTVKHFTMTPSGTTTNDVGGWPWIDTIGATNFVVNVRADPGATGFPFGWSVDASQIA